MHVTYSVLLYDFKWLIRVLLCGVIQFEGLADTVLIKQVLYLAPWHLCQVWVLLALLSNYVQHPAKHVSLVYLLAAWVIHMPLQIHLKLVSWGHVSDAL